MSSILYKTIIQEQTLTYLNFNLKIKTYNNPMRFPCKGITISLEF